MSKILVVDDEPNVLAAFKDLLERGEHRVLAAPDAETGLEILDAEAPDLVIMDVRLPGMDGLSAFRKIRESHPRLPVIIMTAQATTDLAIEATKLGAFDYQLKPFEPAEMLRSVDKALDGVRLMQRQVELEPKAPSESKDAMLGQSRGMQEVYKLIGRVAASTLR